MTASRDVKTLRSNDSYGGLLAQGIPSRSAWSYWGRKQSSGATHVRPDRPKGFRGRGVGRMGCITIGARREVGCPELTEEVIINEGQHSLLPRIPRAPVGSQRERYITIISSFRIDYLPLSTSSSPRLLRETRTSRTSFVTRAADSSSAMLAPPVNLPKW